MTGLKKAFWTLRAELKNLVMWVANGTPGLLGESVRRMVYGRYLKRLGKDTVFQSGLRIASPEFVAIGSNCNFAQRVFITGGGGIEIGDWVGFGPDTKVWSVNHRFDDPDTPWLLQGWEKKPVVIEDDVWLGANVFVMPGVRIGKGAIVSAGTVVSKSVPPYSIVTGNPGRVIGWRKQPPAATPASAPGENARPAGTNPAEQAINVQV